MKKPQHSIPRQSGVELVEIVAHETNRIVNNIRTLKIHDENYNKAVVLTLIVALLSETLEMDHPGGLKTGVSFLKDLRSQGLCLQWQSFKGTHPSIGMN